MVGCIELYPRDILELVSMIESLPYRIVTPKNDSGANRIGFLVQILENASNCFGLLISRPSITYYISLRPVDIGKPISRAHPYYTLMRSTQGRHTLATILGT